MRKISLYPLLAIMFCLLHVASLAGADEISDLFETGDAGSGKPDSGDAEDAGANLLEEYQGSFEKYRFSFNLTAAAGAYFGWASIPDITDIAGMVDGISYLSVGGVNLLSTLDMRPYDYLRLHGQVAILYPTTINGSLLFGASIQELFLDYAATNLFSFRAGRFPVAWGNARIYNIADLPGRIIDVSDLASDIDIQPGWLTSTKPSTWFKAALPLGRISFTGLAGFPSDPTDLSYKAMAYGMLVEYLLGKSALGVAGFYQRAFTTRAAVTAKTSLLGYDLYIDSAISFPYEEYPLFSGTIGCSYNTVTGPDIRVLAEVSYNGERIPGLGDLVPDAPDIGGFSSAIALSWIRIGASGFTVGGTWYHAYGDGSGALVALISVDIAPLITVRAVLPLMYGAASSEYWQNKPAETGGYALGMGLVFVLGANF